MENILKNERVTLRNEFNLQNSGNCVLCIIQRSQRPFDNPLLNRAISAANSLKIPVLAVIFVMNYPRANARHYQFFLDGLKDVADGLLKRKIPLNIKIVENKNEMLAHISFFNPKVVFMDENPIKEMEFLRKSLSQELKIPFFTVDCDVVVPSKLIEKEVYNARILKLKYKDLLPRFLVKEEDLEVKFPPPFLNEPNFFSLEIVSQKLKIESTISLVKKKGGYYESIKVLNHFLKNNLKNYSEKRNDPNENCTSFLSPYLHFGNISPIKVAFEVLSSHAPIKEKESFLDQLIIRRELAINFVKHNKNYESLNGCEPWAIKTLEKHLRDFRQVYSLKQLENCETKDPLWNSANRQMQETGYMHNYLRMYWAKQLLFWTKSPEEAFETAVYLNDKYLLDGRDPNGYAGIAWAIGGKHDRPFPPDKPVMGLIRPMTYNGTKRKFDIQKFCRKFK